MPASLDSSRPIMAPSVRLSRPPRCWSYVPCPPTSLRCLLSWSCLARGQTIDASACLSYPPSLEPSRLVSPLAATAINIPDPLSRSASPRTPLTASTCFPPHKLPRSRLESWHSTAPMAAAPADTVACQQNRTSVRFSTYSMVAPSLTPTFQTSDSAQAEIRDIALGLDRMENKALSSQRVVLSDEKTDNMSKLALGAKLERALDRRMSSQDAVMRPRQKSIKVSISEKTPISEKA
ncbi:hypothetical protein JDV02_004106 [Purpureocillium takamizusanense]|uniref:Uncharacterized protein n=1 Tax=Purpureocillium takamizusanense TaxID=2060973 RepID=A0A9Q8QEI9_9HYPO|nr:uncharacterized protein JDV02_004106 [Purpureocillium takamizusanense]UNI17787.1 hypothetical protein JDV02_004106 [Purpureocillium takamizusanense]